MFTFDIETAGTESNSVILSAALIEWEPGQDFTYQDLLDRACFVKFKATEQLLSFGRKTDKSTLEWWSKQNAWARVRSLMPNAGIDVGVEEGVQTLRKYYHNSSSTNKIIWIRGSLDQVVMDSLCRAADLPELAKYNTYRDVRTAIDLLIPGAVDGYCTVPGFDRAHVKKHDPVHDCAYDIMMMRYGDTHETDT